MTPQQDPSFRPMQEEDRDDPAVYGFNCGDEPWAEKVGDYLRCGEAWADHINRKNKSQTLLYCADGGQGEIIGFTNLVKRKVKFPLFHGKEQISCFLITNIAVAKSYHRQGHASAMLESIIISAIKADLDAVYLLVDKRNQAARRLYEEKFQFSTFADADPYVDKDGSKNVRMIRLLKDGSVS